MSDDDVRKAMSTLIRHDFHGLPLDILNLFTKRALEALGREQTISVVIFENRGTDNDIVAFWSRQEALLHIKTTLIENIGEIRDPDVAAEIIEYLNEDRVNAAMTAYSEYYEWENNIEIIEVAIQ